MESAKKSARAAIIRPYLEHKDTVASPNTQPGYRIASH